MRLDKFMTATGKATRKEAKAFAKAGRIKVNGIVVKDTATIINENEDTILLDDIKISYEEYHYLMLYKPEGYVCSAMEKGEHSCFELIKEDYVNKLSFVGRLDKDTTGLLLITDDGRLNHNLISPSKHVDKTYRVHTEDALKNEYIEVFKRGVDIGDDKPTKPANLKIISEKECLLTIHEGRFHQVKRMFEAVDNKVVKLHRESIKDIHLDSSLNPGEYRVLTEDEINSLKEE